MKKRIERENKLINKEINTSDKDETKEYPWPRMALPKPTPHRRQWRHPCRRLLRRSLPRNANKSSQVSIYNDN